MSDPSNAAAPCFTKVPNAILDAMPQMEPSELGVTLVIARLTIGWHKQRDRISLTQFQDLTGFSRQYVIEGIEAGIKRGVIVRTPVDETNLRRGMYYELLVSTGDQQVQACEEQQGEVELVSSGDQLVSEGDQQEAPLSPVETSPSLQQRPALVSSGDIQKKEERKTKETPSSSPDSRAREVAGGDGDEPLKGDGEQPFRFRRMPDKQTSIDLWALGFDSEPAISKMARLDVDHDTLIESVQNLLASNMSHGAVVKWIMQNPPETGHPWPRREPATPKRAPTKLETMRARTPAAARASPYQNGHFPNGLTHTNEKDGHDDTS